MNIKSRILALALLAGLSLVQACQSEDASKAQTGKATVQAPTRSESVVFDMQNMTCAMCSITIKKALQGVEGVQAVMVDSDTETAAVTFDPQKTNMEALIKATTQAGYPATIQQPK